MNIEKVSIKNLRINNDIEGRSVETSSSALSFQVMNEVYLSYSFDSQR